MLNLGLLPCYQVRYRQHVPKEPCIMIDFSSIHLNTTGVA